MSPNYGERKPVRVMISRVCVGIFRRPSLPNLST